MLGDYETYLVLTAVDGELTAEESSQLDTLLNRSVAAQELLNSLTHDRDRIANLPRHSAPDELTAAIMSAIHAQNPIIRSVKVPNRPNRWVPIALAASVFVAISSITYSFLTTNSAPRLAKRQLQQLPQDHVVLVPKTTTTQRPDQAPSIPDVQLPPERSVAPVETQPGLPEATPAPKTSQPSIDPDRILAAPVGNDVKAFDRVDLKLPLLISMSELRNEESQNTLKKNLLRDGSTRVDLFAKDTTRAAEALIASGKKLNLAIQIETIAGERLKRKMPSAWWIYTEALTPAEITQWLTETATADSRLQADRVFTDLHAIPAGSIEHKDAMTLAGIDLANSIKQSGNGHIASNTIDQVTGALQKSQSPKPALLLTYLPSFVRVPPQLSRDIKQFNESRSVRKSGTTPLVIVIRPVQ